MPGRMLSNEQGREAECDAGKAKGHLQTVVRFEGAGKHSGDNKACQASERDDVGEALNA
jgi:hypothetical protein